MRFTKMQGIGNDYVYVNCLEEHVEDPAAAARLVSDRHFGIGADGLILIKPSQEADFEMDMYNADGSRGKMCGNGIRCVGKYVYDAGLTDSTELNIMTGSGIRRLTLFPGSDGKVEKVRVDMGLPILQPDQIPVSFPGQPKESVISSEVMIGSELRTVTCVSMGNPHCVVCVEDPAALDIASVGEEFAHDPAFPEGVNTEFIRVLDRRTVQMRVWERGSGETLACGTGACAVAVACFLNGWTERTVTVRLLGGDLDISWDETDGHVYMTGPAVTVFCGEIEI